MKRHCKKDNALGLNETANYFIKLGLNRTKEQTAKKIKNI